MPRIGSVLHYKIAFFSHQNILNLCQCEDELGFQKLKLLTGNMEEKSKNISRKVLFGIDYQSVSSFSLSLYTCFQRNKMKGRQNNP